MRRPLFTIHGVGIAGNMGGWEEAVLKVISPHFECCQVKYPHFRQMGLILTVIEPWILLPGLGLSGMLGLLTGLKSVWPWLTLLFALFAAVKFTSLRRNRALRHFIKQFVDPLRLKPNIIAHSMGTYLLGTALCKERPAVSVNHVILAGCVLPTDFPWQEIHSSRQAAFSSIRNEVGRLDPIPRFAYLASKWGLLPSFGKAGSEGFQLIENFVHTMRTPNTMCEDCKKECTIAPVHNVHGPFGHNGALTAVEAALYWLPWLWGLEYDKYIEWIQMCLTADAHYQDNNGPKLRIVEEELLEWHWKDCDNNTLKEIIEKFIRSHRRKPRVRGKVTAQVLCRLYRDVAAACRAHQERGIGWDKEILSLNPEIAVARAVDRVLE
jgi:pimeloyl-ACP methyl ester carboxylesterase